VGGTPKSDNKREGDRRMETGGLLFSASLRTRRGPERITTEKHIKIE
jgi:hypothetical protein